MIISIIQSTFPRTPQIPRGITLENKKNEERSQGKQKQREGTGWFGLQKKPTLSTMSLSELLETKNQQIKSKNFDLAIKYLERAVTLCDDINMKAALIIELADILFKQQKYDEAAKWYNEFTVLYPGNASIEYASYRNVVCSSKKLLSYDRDQTPTEKTIELANKFLSRGDIFTTYQEEIKKIRNECYNLLALSECDKAHFYIKQGNYSAAQNRLESIREQQLEKAPEIHHFLAQLEVDLAAAFKEFKAPESSINLAQVTNTEKKKDMSKRF